MKVRVKQAHSRPSADGRWIDHPLGQELEIEDNEFAENLHEQLENSKLRNVDGEKNPKSAIRNPQSKEKE